MKHLGLRRLFIGIFGIVAAPVFAGGVDIIQPCRDCGTIPYIPSGWGFTVESSALRAYNNNLIFSVATLEQAQDLSAGNIYETTHQYDNYYTTIHPNYAFNLLVGVDYAIKDTGNVLKFYYEHYFSRLKTENLNFQGTQNLQDITGALMLSQNSDAFLREKLDSVSLVSVQHFLLGAFWESTVTGGLRFAHLRQELTNQFILSDNTGPGDTNVTANSAVSTMQFNGVGPLAGISALFHLNGNLAVGAEGLGAILVGRNKISLDNQSVDYVYPGPSAIEGNSNTNHIDPIYNIVPELDYRIYADYSYIFANRTGLEIQAGWRGNQFFNLRTSVVLDDNSFSQSDSFSYTTQQNTTTDDIGYSGPYLMITYQL